MATRAFTSTAIGSSAERLIWTGLLNGDDGTPYGGMLDAIRNIQITGTFGVGGTVVLEGTLEATPTNYQTLNDLQGNALTFTSGTNRIEQVQEGILTIRPRVTAGDGTTSLIVTVMQARRSGGVI